MANLLLTPAVVFRSCYYSMSIKKICLSNYSSQETPAIDRRKTESRCKLMKAGIPASGNHTEDLV